MDTNSGRESAEEHPADLAELRRQFAQFGEAQAKQSRILDIHTGKFSALDRALIDIRLAASRSDHEIRTVRDEFSGRFEHLDNEVAGLRREIIADDGPFVGLSQDLVKLTDNVKVLDVKVDTLQADVTELKTDVTELKDNATVLEVKVDKLQAGITELLDRLPARAA